ncbi:hypothetical protein J503_3923, partial [Acinetobacter baumannii 984213]
DNIYDRSKYPNTAFSTRCCKSFKSFSPAMPAALIIPLLKAITS